jgi:hypothetical protein
MLPSLETFPSQSAAITAAGDARIGLTRRRWETRFDFSGATAFAQLDGLVRSTLSRKFGNRFNVEAEPDYSHRIITY